MKRELLKDLQKSTLSNHEWRKKLLYVATHRGTKEGDLIIGGFARDNVFDMDDKLVEHFAILLEYPDSDIMDWLHGHKSTPEEINPELLHKIHSFIFQKKPSNLNTL